MGGDRKGQVSRTKRWYTIGVSKQGGHPYLYPLMTNARHELGVADSPGTTVAGRNGVDISAES